MAYYIQITIGSWQTAFEWVPEPHPRYWGIQDEFTRNGTIVRFPDGLVPEFALTKSKRKQLPDFIVVNAAMCMSQRLRDRIEMLEPGRNQYVPFTPLGPGRAPYPGPDGAPIRYYMLHVTERIDAVDLARSAPSRIVAPPKYNVQPKHEKVVVHRSRIMGHHVWSGRLQLPDDVFISDTLGDWIIANKMKGMEIYKVEESDD